MGWLRDRIRFGGEKGQSILLVAAALPVLLAVSALVVDGSNLFVNKRSLQNAADAAALAAVQDLSTAGCTSACQNSVGQYAGLNKSNPSNPNDPSVQTALPACASATSKNCYTNPYKGNPTQVEVRLTRHVNTLFGHIFGLVHDVSVRSVATISSGPPPELTFAALNQSAGCEHHTLVVRSSGNLVVNNNIYVNSTSGIAGCGKGDGFDIFGTGGSVSAKDIFTFGGWETHAGLSVHIPVGGPACTLLTATAATPPQAGCPKTGQPAVVDPFAGKIIAPPIDLAGVANTSCTPANPCYSVAEFNSPWWLDASMTAAAPSLVADKTTCNPACNPTVPAANSFISVDGERMKVTATANAPGGSLGGSKTFSVTRGTVAVPVLGTVAAAHTEPAFNVVADRRAFNVVTLTTSAPHGFNIGDEVRVNMADNTFDGVFTVSEIPDDETAANPVQFTYVIPGGLKVDVGQAVITGALRTGGVATLTTAAALPGSVVVGSPVVVDITTGHTDTASICSAGFGTCADTSFNETPEDAVTIASISASRKSFTYAQPGLPGTKLTIQKIGRFDGNTTIVNAAGDTFNKTAPASDFVAGANKTIAYPPDATFSGTFPLATVSGNNTFTYANNGCAGGCPDIGFTVEDTQNVLYAARWNNVATIETQAALKNLDTVTPNNRVDISLAGADTSFNGAVDITSIDPNNNKTFSYPSTGSNSLLGPAINVTQVNRNNGNVATLTVANVATLDVGDLVVVNSSIASFNNGGNPVVLTAVGGNAPGTIKYANVGGAVANTPATGDVKLVGGAPSAGSTAKKRKIGQLTVNASGGLCDPATAALCSVRTWTDDRDTSSGIVGSATVSPTCSNCVAGPLFEIFAVTTTQTVPSDRTHPSAFTVPAGIAVPPLNPGTYYGGICIGAPAGASCGTKVGGSCNTSATSTPTVTMNPGIYIMAGGGFFVCGNTMLIAKGVMIYNTVDSATLAVGANANAALLDQVKFNTNGNVFMSGVREDPFVGMTIFQGTNPDPAPAAVSLTNPNLQLSDTKCDGRATNSTDIALLHMGTTGLGNPAVTNSGIPSGISGTIYAPAQHALFRDTVSGTSTLAVITGCIFIDGANSTFNFDSTDGGDLHGVGYAMSE